MEALEAALADENTALAATEALRVLVGSMLATPGEARGEVFLSLRGDLAVLLEMAEAERGANDKSAVLREHKRRSREVLGTWDAGTGFGLHRALLQ